MGAFFAVSVMPIFLPRWAGTQRTPQHDARLGLNLAFMAGAINAGGFMAIGYYTSHMTGVISAVADDLILGQLALVSAGLMMVVAFLLGAMCTAILVNMGRRQRLHGRYSIPLLLEASLLALFGLIGHKWAFDTPMAVPMTALLLSFMMGLQNALITKISNSVIRTTHVTGLVTDMGIELGKLIYINTATHPRAKRVRANRGRLKLHASLLAAFLGGGILGAWGFQRFGFLTALPLALWLLLLALRPLFFDFRVRRNLRRWQRRRSQIRLRP